MKIRDRISELRRVKASDLPVDQTGEGGAAPTLTLQESAVDGD